MTTVSKKRCVLHNPFLKVVTNAIPVHPFPDGPKIKSDSKSTINAIFDYLIQTTNYTRIPIIELSLVRHAVYARVFDREGTGNSVYFRCCSVLFVRPSVYCQVRITLVVSQMANECVNYVVLFHFHSANSRCLREQLLPPESVRHSIVSIGLVRDAEFLEAVRANRG